MQNDKIPHILEQAGLSRAEATVYLALLALGTRPAGAIAKSVGIKRGHTYNLLASLTQRGIVQEFLKSGVRQFTASTPKAVIAQIEREEDRLRETKKELLSVLPLLQQMQNPLLSQPTVRFFHGIEGIKEIYEDTIREKDHDIFAVADFDYIFTGNENGELLDWIWSYAKRRAERNIRYLGIVRRSPCSDRAYQNRKAEKRRLKVLDSVEFPVEVNVYLNKVAIMSTHAAMIGLIIEDQHIASTLRSLHQGIWSYLPNYSIQG